MRSKVKNKMADDRNALVAIPTRPILHAFSVVFYQLIVSVKAYIIIVGFSHFSFIGPLVFVSFAYIIISHRNKNAA